MFARIVVCVGWIVGFGLSYGAAADPFTFRDGDRVLLIGGTFIERDVNFGDMETMLAIAAGAKRVSFRNLGWSGDTVWAESRGIFDAPEAGYRKLLELSKELKPTAAILCYGANESFAGASRRAAFIAQYEKLIDDVAATGARTALLTPPPFWPTQPPLPPMDEANARLNDYVDAIRDLAKRKNVPLIDLHARLTREAASSGSPTQISENGVHVTPKGSRLVAAALYREATGSDSLPPSDRIEPLRTAILKKNELFFHRWRPQNVTYLFLFRKHEQGNNAVEIPQFDALVEEHDGKIDALRRGKN